MLNSGNQIGLRTKILDLGLSLGLGVRYCSQFWSGRFGLGFRLDGLVLLNINVKQAPSYCFLSTLLHLTVFYIILTLTVMSWSTTNNNTVTSETLEEVTPKSPVLNQCS